MILLRRRFAALLVAALAMAALGVLLASVSGATGGGGPSSTNVGGLISTDTTWTSGDSPVIVTSSLLVQQGVTLTIEPGVEVRFDPGLALQVSGELVARGTADAPAVFTSNQPAPVSGDWGSILFTDTSVDAVYDATGDYLSGSILEYCTIEFAGGVSGSNRALKIAQSGPFINYCTVKDSAGGGIMVEYGTLRIMNSTIMRNTAPGGGDAGRGGGIYINPGGTHTLSNNIITGNIASRYGGGIYIQYATATLSDNTITGNTASLDGGGIYIYGAGIFGGGTVTLSSNTIMSNSASGDGGAINIGGGGATLLGNTLIGNSSPSSVVYFYGGCQLCGSLSVFNNNLFANDAPYLVYSALTNTEPDANMENNWWGTTDEGDIRSLIFDWFDDPSTGFVEYNPFLTAPNTGAPVSPPMGLVVTGDARALSIDLGWTTNPEGDIAGYKVHYKTGDGGFPYEGTGASEGDSGIDVGNVTGATISGLSPWVAYHVAVTAYDVDGNESWYSADGDVTLEPGVDNAPPYTAGHDPVPGASGIPSGTNIVVHVRDDGSGVDQGSIELTVEGAGVTGQAVITGGSGDYTVTYDAPADFDYGQVVDVAVDANDLAGNPMATDVYSFTVMMPVCLGRSATIIGTPGDDVLAGTPDDDVIVGLEGDDVILASAGDDFVCGGPGDDFVDGGRGNDRVVGNEGNDFIRGRRGNDRLYSNAGDDVLEGGAGRDRLFGHRGQDILLGGRGRDSHNCGRGYDFANGGPGTDTAKPNCESAVSVP